MHDTRQPGDEDLLNIAAIFAHRGDGKVYAIPKKQMPNGSPAVAALRFPLAVTIP
jgi:hypothetical protein